MLAILVLAKRCVKKQINVHYAELVYYVETSQLKERVYLIGNIETYYISYYLFCALQF